MDSQGLRTTRTPVSGLAGCCASLLHVTRRTGRVAEENLDGKYLLRTADPKTTAEDIALGYKQLLEVERGWRDMKQVIDLRPVYHRREDRIRARVLLCWLALLLARIAENACDRTWPELRRELGKIQVGTFTGPAGTFRQRTELTTNQRGILKTLENRDPAPHLPAGTPRRALTDEAPRLDTRRRPSRRRVPARQPPFPPTRPLHQLRNPG